MTNRLALGRRGAVTATGGAKRHYDGPAAGDSKHLSNWWEEEGHFYHHRCADNEEIFRSDEAYYNSLLERTMEEQ